MSTTTANSKSPSRPKPKARVKPQAALKATKKNKKLQTKFTLGRVGPERRRHARFKVVPMYSTVIARRGASSPALEGHLYEISEGGMRFELDDALALGERINIEITLPGCPRAIAVRGKIVRVNDIDDDPGPRRMVMEFESFVNVASRATLERYLSQRWLARAA